MQACEDEDGDDVDDDSNSVHNNDNNCDYIDAEDDNDTDALDEEDDDDNDDEDSDDNDDTTTTTMTTMIMIIMVSGEHYVNVTVKGSGFMAEIVRMFLSTFNSHQKLNSITTNDACLPRVYTRVHYILPLIHTTHMYTITHTLSLSNTHHTYAHKHILSLSFPLSHTHKHTRTICVLCMHTHTHILSPPTNRQTDRHTHTHTNAHTHTLSSPFSSILPLIMTHPHLFLSSLPMKFLISNHPSPRFPTLFPCLSFLHRSLRR